MSCHLSLSCYRDTPPECGWIHIGSTGKSRWISVVGTGHCFCLTGGWPIRMPYIEQYATKLPRVGCFLFPCLLVSILPRYPEWRNAVHMEELLQSLGPSKGSWEIQIQSSWTGVALQTENRALHRRPVAGGCVCRRDQGGIRSPPPPLLRRFVRASQITVTKLKKIPANVITYSPKQLRSTWTSPMSQLPCSRRSVLVTMTSDDLEYHPIGY